jgi:restriction system protein
MGYGGPFADETGELMEIANDKGFDDIICVYKLGFSNIYINAKRRSPDTTIDRQEIQTFVGAISSKQGDGLFVTTAMFSKYAIQFARENNIVLIDGKKLTSLMITYGVGVLTVKSYDIKSIDFNFFHES